MIEVYARNTKVLNDTSASENNENKRFCFQYTFEMYLAGTTIVVWKTTFYIIKEQKRKRIVCEEQPQRRLTSKD